MDVLALAETLLRENLALPERAALVDPLIDALRRTIAKRFRIQGRFAVERLRIVKPLLEAVDDVAERDAQWIAAAPLANVPLIEYVDSLLIKAVLAGAQTAALELSMSINWNLKSPVVQRYLDTRSAEKMGRDVDRTTREMLRDVLSRGYQEGWTFAKLKREIRSLYSGFSRTRAETIAVTEMANAFSAGTLAMGSDLENRGLNIEKSWLVADAPCAICEGNAADGWIPLNDSFSSGHDAPSAHPRCKCSLLTRQA